MLYKKDFPIFQKHKKLVYLDSAATTQKPRQVIDAVIDFYKENNSNVARGLYDLSLNAQELYENSRKKIADFINAGNSSEIVFTGNATEAINLAAFGYFEKNLKKGDYIILSEMEHHSNIVPWIRLKDKLGIKLIYIPVTADFEIDYKWFLAQNIEPKKIKLISLTHASNVLGTINPLEEIIPIYKKKFVNAKILIDAAQSIAHIKIDVKKLNCDFLALSSHKMYGPSGVGVLYAKEEILEKMDPIFFGGHMIISVTKNKANFKNAPEKFEAGTGRLEAVVGMGAAVDYLRSLDIKSIQKYEHSLTEHALKELLNIKDIQFYGNTSAKHRLPIFSFNITGVHPHDGSEILNRYNIDTRAGHHCAQVLMDSLGIFGTVRVSLALYNTKEDIDQLVFGINQVKKILKK
jgi:cysteine desulfurase / selenocysteine lyase